MSYSQDHHTQGVTYFLNGLRRCTRLIKHEKEAFCLMYRFEIKECPPKCPWTVKGEPAIAEEVLKAGIDPYCLNLDRGFLETFVCKEWDKEPVVRPEGCLCKDCEMVIYRTEEEELVPG